MSPVTNASVTLDAMSALMTRFAIGDDRLVCKATLAHGCGSGAGKWTGAPDRAIDRVASFAC